jgi:ABC-type hemin transport system ATPase subunit
VESVYDKLFNAFGLWRERPHELSGLRARLAARIALHNFCIWLNDQLGRSRLAFAELLGWWSHNSHQAFKDSPILILDEATSSVDTQTEEEIQEALHELMQERTAIVIAHRLSTVRHADLIVVLERGSIVELGTHEHLMRCEGLYRNLYDRQFGAAA